MQPPPNLNLLRQPARLESSSSKLTSLKLLPIGIVLRIENSIDGNEELCNWAVFTGLFLNLPNKVQKPTKIRQIRITEGDGISNSEWCTQKSATYYGLKNRDTFEYVSVTNELDTKKPLVDQQGYLSRVWQMTILQGTLMAVRIGLILSCTTTVLGNLGFWCGE